MIEYGVWIKLEPEDVLVHTGSKSECEQYIETETLKNTSGNTAWRLDVLPVFRVESTPKGHPTKIVAAYYNKESALLFARDYLENNETLVGPEDVKVTW